jgi:Pyruvate/2-oxoacid:ferredoxin oxidoreductase gamma subunit
VKSIAVLDRTKEPGASGEPLYLDVMTALAEIGGAAGGALNAMPRVIGGRYGLSSKEFTPAMVKAVYDELLQARRPSNHFTVGILDDVTHTSLPVDYGFDIEEPEDVVRAVFYGLGSDGTVGANKNSIKIIGEDTPNYAQGYFVYDSKKSGSITVSHLRFGPKPIRAPYLIRRANFIAVHQFFMLEQHNVLKACRERRGLPAEQSLRPGRGVGPPAAPGAGADHQEEAALLCDRRLQGRAELPGMGRRINTVMQTCFFAISGVLPREEAIAAIKHAVEKTYGKRGEAIVRKNHEAIDNTLANLLRRERAHDGDEHGRACACRYPAGRARVCAARDGGDHRRPRRRVAGERAAGGRHLPHGHREVGEARDRTGSPRVGRGAVHPVRQMRAGLPALGDSRQDLPEGELSSSAPSGLQGDRCAAEGVQGAKVHPAGRGGGLHGLQAVRGGLSGEGQDRGEAQGHQHGALCAAARAGSRKLGLLRGVPGAKPRACCTSTT